MFTLSQSCPASARARVVAGQKAAYLKNMRRAVGAGLAALAASKVPDADWGDATCAAKDPEVRFVVLDEMPESVTHELINAWSDGFRLPTVVRNAFKEFGRVVDVYLPLDYMTKQPRGFAFVEMGDRRSAAAAIDGLDGKVIDNRAVKVLFATQKRKRPDQMQTLDPRTARGAYRGPPPRGPPPPGYYGGGGGYRGRSPDRRRRDRSRSRSRSRRRRRRDRSPSRSRSRRRD